MNKRFSIGEALASLGVKEWVLSNEPTNEVEFLQYFSKVIGVDENQNAVLSNNFVDFGVTWSEVQAEITRLEADYAAKQFQRDRVKEYPPIGDQLDALWKGGEAAAEMLAKVQAVKAKYPKE